MLSQSYRRVKKTLVAVKLSYAPSYPKLSQSCRKVMIKLGKVTVKSVKLPESYCKVIVKLSQSCRKVVTLFSFQQL